MALFTTKPSIPVLQSDTFEIQRRKINNLATDINTKLDSAPASWIGYAYIKSFKFNYWTVGGNLHIRFNDTTDSTGVGWRTMPLGGNVATANLSKLEYDLQTDVYDLTATNWVAGYPVMGYNKYNVLPSQFIQFIEYGGKSESDNYWYLGAPVGVSQSINANSFPTGGVPYNKFEIQFVMIDGRIATHTYTITSPGYKVVYLRERWTLQINAAAAAKGHRALRMMNTIGGVGGDVDSSSGPFFEDNFTITYS